MDADPEAFICEECEDRILRERFTRADREAMTLYHDLARPVVVDLHLTRLVFDLAQLRLTEDEARLLLGKLDLIHTERKNAAEAAQAAAAPHQTQPD